MKRYKKFFICMMLTLVIPFTNIGSAIATEPIEESVLTGYDIYYAPFSNVQGYSLNEQSSNIDQAKSFVKSLNLSSRGFIGLEQAFVDELDALDVENVQLNSYAVALPRTEEYYGTYDGFLFQAAYSFYSECYFDNLYGKSNHEQWAAGIINVLMNFAPKKVSIPFSIFSSISANAPQFYSGARTELTNEDEITSRTIMIQDKNQQASLNEYSFVPVIQDMSRVSHTSVVCYSGNPYINPTLDASAGTVEAQSENFYNTQYNLKRGYAHYIAGYVSDCIVETVPKAEFNWSEPK